jgi:hypothetical protein
METWRLYKYKQGKIRNYIVVSDQGRVRSGFRFLKFGVSGTMRYYTVFFHGRTHYVHQLVAEAFHGPRPEGQEVRHKNGKCRDNRADNLHWGTRQQNIMDAIGHGTHISLNAKGEGNPNARITDDIVREIWRLKRETKLTCRQIGSKFGLARDTVQGIWSGKRWSHVEDK